MLAIEEYCQSLSGLAPPAGLSVALASLWWAGKGEWNRAHQLAQARAGDAACDWVHAYLHRSEGDHPNAAYWYRKAGRPEPAMSSEEEWRALAEELLS